MKIEASSLPIIQAIRNASVKRTPHSINENLCKILALLEYQTAEELDIELVMAHNPYDVLIFPSVAMAFNIVLIAFSKANINYCSHNSNINISNNSNNNIIAPKSLYLPFKNALDQEAKCLGLNIAYYNEGHDDHNYSNYYEENSKPKGANLKQEIKALITPETKLIIIEGQMAHSEIKEIIKIAKKYNLLTLMHNSTETSIFFKALKAEIDIVIYSLSALGIVSFSKKLIETQNDSSVNKAFYNEFCLKLYSSYKNFDINVPEEDCLRLQEKLPILPLIMKEKSQNALALINWLKNVRIIEKLEKFSLNSALILIILDKNYHEKSIENMLKHLRVFSVAKNISCLQEPTEYNSYIFYETKQPFKIIVGCGLEGVPALIADLERAFNRLITTEALLLQDLEDN